MPCCKELYGALNFCNTCQLLPPRYVNLYRGSVVTKLDTIVYFDNETSLKISCNGVNFSESTHFIWDIRFDDVGVVSTVLLGGDTPRDGVELTFDVKTVGKTFQII